MHFEKNQSAEDITKKNETWMKLRQLYGANVSFTLYKYKVKKHRLHTGGEGTLQKVLVRK